jgi:hypothetical protein
MFLQELQKRSRIMDSPKAVKIKVSDMYDAAEALRNLMSDKHKIVLAHRLAMSLRAIKVEQDTVEERREHLVETWAERGEDDQKRITRDDRGRPTVIMKNQDAFDKEWKELLHVELEITVYPVNVTSFGDKFQIAPADLEILLKLGILEITEEGPEA